MRRYLDQVFTAKISFVVSTFRGIYWDAVKEEGDGRAGEELDRVRVTRWRSISFNGFVEVLSRIRSFVETGGGFAPFRTLGGSWRERKPRLVNLSFVGSVARSTFRSFAKCQLLRFSLSTSYNENKADAIRGAPIVSSIQTENYVFCGKHGTRTREIISCSLIRSCAPDHSNSWNLSYYALQNVEKKEPEWTKREEIPLVWYSWEWNALRDRAPDIRMAGGRTNVEKRSWTDASIIYPVVHVFAPMSVLAVSIVRRLL